MLRGTPGLMPALRDEQDARVVCWCRRCSGEVYEEETLYVWEGKRICEDCFKETVSAWVDKSPREVANVLLVDTITA